MFSLHWKIKEQEYFARKAAVEALVETRRHGSKIIICLLVYIRMHVRWHGEERRAECNHVSKRRTAPLSAHE